MDEPYFTQNGKFRNPVIEQRHRELQEIWKPRLNDILIKTAESFKLYAENKDYGFDIQYDEKLEEWAHINPKKKLITTGQKFFQLDNIQKEKVLMHEFSHVVLRYTKHTSSIKNTLRSCDIPATVPDLSKWRDE
jgi:hypothetical protein